MEAELPPTGWHVLLVGIDAYAHVRPLHGTIHDIDAVEAILLDRLKVPAAAITRLAAPHASHVRRSRVPERPPTYANLRAALEDLGSEKTLPGDRVLVHYSGHGTQVLPVGSRVAREALVPVDMHAGGALLYDCELNELLARIARRTADLTVVLDCCCSAGATRDLASVPGSAKRFCDVEGAAMPFPSRTRALNLLEPSAGLLSSVDPADPGYLVAAACQAGEAANEAPGDLGRTHGAFTTALLEALAACPDGDLATLSWADVWEALRERVTSRHRGQHPWLIGRAERRIFGGPFRPRDPGYPVRLAGGAYRIGAGSMVGLTRGAKVAVYGPTPDAFPPLGSREDLAARIGVLHVEASGPASCTAAPMGPAFALVQGARGRWIAAGERDALVVELEPYDPALAGWLQANGSLWVVPARRPAGATEIPEAFVGRSPEGWWWLGDDLFGTGGEPPLAWIPPGDHEALLGCLLHYARYALALRLARRCRDLPHALDVRVLDCRDGAALAAAHRDDAPLPEASADPEHRTRYLVHRGQPICIAAENRSAKTLYVTLFDCAASGCVEVLGAHVEIPPGRRQVFWMFGRIGQPFRCDVPDSRASAVDRLIAVGTTVPGVDLSFLQVPRSFEEVLSSRVRDVARREHEPGALWTATLATLRITRG